MELQHVDFYEFLWGGKNGWFIFDNAGNVTTNKFPKYYTEWSWITEWNTE